MALTAYFDAGGHQQDQKYLVVAGFAASVEMWLEFDRSWTERLRRDGLDYFHAVEFAHSYGQFASGWREDEPRRRALSSDLMDILKRNVSRKFMSVTINEALDDKMNDETKSQFHINAYSLGGRTCCARLREWLEEEQWKTALELVFEDGDIGKGLLSKTLLRDGFPEPLFKPKKDRLLKSGLIERGAVPLQAADWLAYETFLATKRGNDIRWAMQEFETTPGPGGIYEARDLERLEKVLNSPIDEIIEGTLWNGLSL